MTGVPTALDIHTWMVSGCVYCSEYIYFFKKEGDVIDGVLFLGDWFMVGFGYGCG